MLVNKRINELTKFTEKDGHHPVLQRICITNDEIVATDGHILGIMPVDKSLTDTDYPAGPAIDTEITRPLLLPAGQIKDAVALLPKKPVLPVLDNIQIGSRDGKTVINAGLPVVQILGDNNEDMAYPNYKQVIPDYDNSTAVRVALDGKLLKILSELAVKHGDCKNQITFQIPTSTDCVKDAVKWKIENEYKMIMFHGVLMPLRITESTIAGQDMKKERKPFIKHRTKNNV